MIPGRPVDLSKDTSKTPSVPSMPIFSVVPPPPLTLLTYSYLELLLSSVFQEERELLRRFGYIGAYHYQASLGGGDMGRKIGRRAESGGWQGRQRRKSGANGDPVCSCAIAGENRGRRDTKKATWSR